MIAPTKHIAKDNNSTFAFRVASKVIKCVGADRVFHGCLYPSDSLPARGIQLHDRLLGKFNCSAEVTRIEDGLYIAQTMSGDRSYLRHAAIGKR